ncbi:MAG: UDP-N-acetylmuramoyl-L-alanyl-D-glutamate--2,6-diaminopimelate ligase [Planctomycetota bacterium]
MITLSAQKSTINRNQIAECNINGSLESIVQHINVLGFRNFHEQEITGISCDSRDIKEGNIFAAVPGVNVDGSMFAAIAVSSGAVAVICEKPLDLPEDVTQIIARDVRKALAQAANAYYCYPSTKIDIIGVTGTTGKTTTAYMISHILNYNSKKTDMFTTIKNSFAGKTIAAKQTTPDAVALTRMIHESVQAGSKHISMEVSSHSLCQKRVAKTRFHCGVFTNLASDHLDYHVTHEAYRDAKAILFQNLNHNAWAVLNSQDKASEYFIRRTNARIIRYSSKKHASVWGRIESTSIDGIVFYVHAFGAVAIIKLPIIGLHNVDNALAAIAACLTCGLSLQQISEAFSCFGGVPGRLQQIETRRDFSVFVDYAHTEGALATVLANVRPFTKGRLIVVFGCGGDRDKTKRPMMAIAAEKNADLCIVTSDNPRTENPETIISDIIKGFSNKDKYLVESNRKKAISLSLSLAKKGDVIIIAGKGHESYQIFSDRTEHFDDCEIVRELL